MLALYAYSLLFRIVYSLYAISAGRKGRTLRAAADDRFDEKGYIRLYRTTLPASSCIRLIPGTGVY